MITVCIYNRDVGTGWKPRFSRPRNPESSENRDYRDREISRVTKTGIFETESLGLKNRDLGLGPNSLQYILYKQLQYKQLARHHRRVQWCASIARAFAGFDVTCHDLFKTQRHVTQLFSQSSLFLRLYIMFAIETEIEIQTKNRDWDRDWDRVRLRNPRILKTGITEIESLESHKNREILEISRESRTRLTSLVGMHTK